MNSLFTKTSLKNQPVDFRIGAVISDGMWYSQMKWRKLAKVTEEEIDAWIKEKLADGTLIQSETGSKSYRFPLKSVIQWYEDHKIEMGVQLIDSIFPPRIWDGKTEVEGFLDAPQREIGIVAFFCSTEAANEVSKALRGIAKVRESEPGGYKAYCLNSAYVREIVDEVLTEHYPAASRKTYSRAEYKRREIVDFSQDFAYGLITFYKNFAKTLVKNQMDTIRIFLPDPEDQDSQITLWVLMAIEKFDEKSAVPFSGYLNSVLKRWPYNLPSDHLGKDLSSFQRSRSRAIEALKASFGEDKNFTNIELAEEMNMNQTQFNDLEEKHRVWTRARNATTLTWDENNDEKSIESSFSGDLTTLDKESTDIVLANKLSSAIIKTALNTGSYEDAFTLMSQIDNSEINMAKIESVSEEFIQELGSVFGVNEE